MLLRTVAKWWNYSKFSLKRRDPGKVIVIARRGIPDESGIHGSIVVGGPAISSIRVKKISTGGCQHV